MQPEEQLGTGRGGEANARESVTQLKPKNQQTAQPAASTAKLNVALIHAAEPPEIQMLLAILGSPVMI